MRKALDADFGRMLKEDRIVKLMAKSDNAVISGQKTVGESLEEVRTPSRPRRRKTTGGRGDGKKGKGRKLTWFRFPRPVARKVDCGVQGCFSSAQDIQA